MEPRLGPVHDRVKVESRFPLQPRPGIRYTSGVEDQLLDAYRKTELRFTDDRGQLWVAGQVDFSPEAPIPWELPVSFHVITAWNPHARRLPPSENAERNEALRKALAELGANAGNITGSSPDGTWQEPGFAVVGLTREEALDIARAYDQIAIFEVEESVIRVIRVEDGAALSVRSLGLQQGP